MKFFDYSEQYDYPIFLEECFVASQNKIFRELINKYHSYVKYSDVPQRRINYLIYRTLDSKVVGAIGISSCVLAISVRDNYIGWDKETRLRNSNMVANNYRFCLVPDNGNLIIFPSYIVHHVPIQKNDYSRIVVAGNHSIMSKPKI